MNIGHISIDCVEFKKKDNGGYKGVEVSVTRTPKKPIKKRFATGDPAADFANAIFWLVSPDSPEVEATMLSSSCDHFTMDTDGWGWYENGVLGELIKPIGEKGPWHAIVRQFGKHKGRLIYVQEGNFVITDNEDGITLLSPDGPVEPKGKFKNVAEAQKHCEGLKRVVKWEQ